MAQPDRAGRVLEEHREHRRDEDRVRDLLTEHGGVLVLAGVSRKQPALIRTAQQNRTVFVEVFLDESGEPLVEGKLEPNAVLDVVLRKDQPERLIRTAGADKVFL